MTTNPYIVQNMGRLFNKSTTDPSLRDDDYAKIESEIIANIYGRRPTPESLIDKNKKELAIYAKGIGIDVSDSSDDDSEHKKRGRSRSRSRSESSSSSRSASPKPGRRQAEYIDYFDKKGGSSSSKKRSRSRSRSRSSSSSSSSEESLGETYKTDMGYDSFAGGRVETNDSFSAVSSFGGYTEEKKRKREADRALKHMGVKHISLRYEKGEDDKADNLAEISDNMQYLKEYGLSQEELDEIPKVTYKSRPSEISDVCNMLRARVARINSSHIATELMLSVAEVAEEVFNGETLWFGRFRPDLTGYRKELERKMKRIKYDAGRIVNGVLKNRNTSPQVRIGLEIIPNVLMYGKSRSEKRKREEERARAGYVPQPATPADVDATREQYSKLKNLV